MVKLPAEPRSTLSEPPTLHRMLMKAAAPATADSSPMPRSTSGSVAQRVSSEMRYSGLGGSLPRDVEMVEALLAEPAGDEVLHDPGPPAHLQGLARQHDADADGGHGGDDEREDEHGLVDGLRIARLQASRRTSGSNS